MLVCLSSVLLDDAIIQFPHRKSTASKNASQFVYKQKNMAVFIHKSFKK